MNYYDEIKNKLINNEVYKRIKDYSKSRNDLETYYEIGKLIIEAQGGEQRAKYGDNLIKEYSIKLTKELNKKYEVTALKRMRQFYLIVQKGATVSHQLTWSHYVELLSLNDNNVIDYYIKICELHNLSVRQLREKIKKGEYQRIPDITKIKLINKKQLEVQD